MKMFQISDKIDNVSRIGIGCMRITGLSDEKATKHGSDCNTDGFRLFLAAVDVIP